MTMFYIEDTIQNIQSSLSIAPNRHKKKYSKLLSIHLQSNNPTNFKSFLDNLETSTIDHSLIEVVVKIDDTDYKMNKLLKSETSKRKISLLH